MIDGSRPAAASQRLSGSWLMPDSPVAGGLQGAA